MSDDIIDLSAYRTKRALRGPSFERPPKARPSGDGADPEGTLDFRTQRLLPRWKVVDPARLPRVGMEFQVKFGRHPYLGVYCRSSRVNGRSFYVTHHGRRTRYLLVEWMILDGETSFSLDTGAVRAALELEPLGLDPDTPDKGESERIDTTWDAVASCDGSVTPEAGHPVELERLRGYLLGYDLEE